VRAWQRELADLRERYRDDPEALACVARSEAHAENLFEVIPTLSPIPTWEQLLDRWAAEVSTLETRTA
jgi:hypothetical protein